MSKTSLILSVSLATTLATALASVPHAIAGAGESLAPPQDQKQTQSQPEEQKPAPKPAKPAESRTDEKGSAAGSTRSQENRPAPKGAPPESQAAGQSHGQTERAPVHYFRPQDRAKLRQSYQAKLSSVNRANRPRLVAGGQISRASASSIEPVPVEIVEVLPPLPAGYALGYWDGYCLVYDPDTLVILSVVDLLD